jgi:hypothetical protein
MEELRKLLLDRYEVDLQRRLDDLSSTLHADAECATAEATCALVVRVAEAEGAMEAAEMALAALREEGMMLAVKDEVGLIIVPSLWASHF